jgi:threonylcarbamoyladenosine tRNA methylthiotransferase MtaB
MTKTFTIQTLGCKVNQYESQQIRQLLEGLGLSPAHCGKPADLVVVNSCCVTGTASAKSRQSLRRLSALNPGAKLILTGCLAAADDGQLDFAENNDIYIVPDKARLGQALEAILSADPSNPSIPPIPAKIKDKNLSEPAGNTPDLQPLKRFSGQCRAFLKIQDGCDAFCSYCIIPKIRTQICNKDTETVISEAENLVLSGHKEIVLSGIFLGAYGQSTARRKHWEAEKRDALAELLGRLAAVPGLMRIRLSSLEPADVTDRLLEVFVKHPTIMPHLHLPLQSGSPAVLRKMCRQYTLSDYVAVVEKVNAALEAPAMTTDIIVGFPGETDDDFEQTMQVSEQIGFAKIHVFPFNARKGTPAEKMPGKVHSAVIKTRANRLQALDNHLQEQFRRRFVGHTASVLVENLRPLRGRCERYFMVDLSTLPDAAKLKRGQIISICL